MSLWLKRERIRTLTIIEDKASGVVGRTLGVDARSHWFDPGLSYRLYGQLRGLVFRWFPCRESRSIAGGRLLSENSRNWKVLRNLWEFLGKFPGGCAECPRVSCRRSMIHAGGGCWNMSTTYCSWGRFVEVTFHKLEKWARKEHTRAPKREGDCVCLDDTPSTRGKEKMHSSMDVSCRRKRPR